MKYGRIVTALLLSLVLAGVVACNPLAQGQPAATQQVVKVARGDLQVTVSGSGNTAAIKDTNLYFRTGGRIDKINVEEGDLVKKGQLLASLETDNLQLAVTQAEVAYAEAQIAVTKAEAAYSDAEAAVTRTELTIIQAQVALQTSTVELEKAQNTYKFPELTIALADVEKAAFALKNAQDRLSDAISANPTGDHSVLVRMIIYAQVDLNVYQRKLDAMLSQLDTDEVAIKKKQVEVAQKSLDIAKKSLDLSKQARDIAKQSPDLARQSADLAKKSLDQARKQLDKTTIIAPYDGFVADVYFKEGDTVRAPEVGAQTVIYLIDLSKLELKVQVDEIDIPRVNVGQKVIVEVDALPGATINGTVSSIGLLPSQKSGVVVYDVKIELSAPEGSGLRAGMSATADIITVERHDVLLVPDRAITTDSQGKSTVGVMVNGQTETRAVTIGTSDGQQTEIVSGLTEGESVVEKAAKASSSSPLFQ